MQRKADARPPRVLRFASSVDLAHTLLSSLGGASSGCKDLLRATSAVYDVRDDATKKAKESIEQSAKEKHTRFHSSLASHGKRTLHNMNTVSPNTKTTSPISQDKVAWPRP